MNNNVKDFIEQYIDLIDTNNYVALFREAYGGDLWLDTSEAIELVSVLSDIGINTTDVREQLLFDLLQEIFESVASLPDENKNRLLAPILCDHTNNLFGFDYDFVVKFVIDNAEELFIDIKSVGASKYSATDYRIEFF